MPILEVLLGSNCFTMDVNTTTTKITIVDVENPELDFLIGFSATEKSSNITSLLFDKILKYIRKQEENKVFSKKTKLNSDEIKYVSTTKLCKKQDSDLVCGICQDEIKKKKKISSLNCSHYYHTVCINKWLKQHNSCPTCRKTF
jgi:hypothetical protein